MRSFSTTNAILTLLATLALLFINKAPAKSAPLWVDLYYPGWIQQSIPPGDIDFADVTIIDNFAIIPNPDGTLNMAANKVDDKAAAELIRQAHLAKRKVLITLGGESTGDQFAASVPSHESDLIKNLTDYVNRLGYDGIDLDIEPIEHRDSNWTLIPADSPARIAAYQQFVRDLRVQMNKSQRHLLLTAAAIPDYAPAIFAPIQSQFDQINIMTYDMAGLWTGQTWFDSNLYSDQSYPTMPSCVKKVAGYVDAGMPRSKLGIGLMLDGLVWTGALKPGDPVTGVTTKYITLSDVITKDFQKSDYIWDDTVQHSYLSIPGGSNSPESKPLFISYDDIHSAQAKAKYCKKNGLGGIILWQMGDGYQAGLADQPVNDVLAAIQKGEQ